MEANQTIESNGESNPGPSGLDAAGPLEAGRTIPRLLLESSAPNETEDKKLFVGGLSWETTTEGLKHYFEVFGNVSNVSIMKDLVTQRGRGFGFITFSESTSIDKVLKVPRHIVDGKQIDAKLATPRNEARSSSRNDTQQTETIKKIFVGGVSQDTSAEEVKAYFAQFGAVDRCVLMMDNLTNKHRGFGFVHFESEPVVDSVCEIHFHTIKNKQVECKKAQPREALASRTSQNVNRFMMRGPPMIMHNTAAPSALPAFTPLTVAQVQAQAAHAASAHAQSAAMAAYGRRFAGYPPLGMFRYSPYIIPPMAAGVGAPPQTPDTQVAPLPPIPHVPYQGYNLANVDMSSFQGVDWSRMYEGVMYS